MDAEKHVIGSQHHSHAALIDGSSVSLPPCGLLAARLWSLHEQKKVSDGDDDPRAMQVIIPGGSGQVGTILARAFHGDGHEVVVLSRSARKGGNTTSVVPGVLTRRGVTFQFPRWPEAAEDLCRRWRQQNTSARRPAREQRDARRALTKAQGE